MAGASAAADPGWSRGQHRDGGRLSIGEVLAQLRAEFPDTTISKLRFLESEGLVEPRRTPAGYRKYDAADLVRLRYVLTAQRDHYLPLRVIREHLAALDRGEAVTGPGPITPPAGLAAGPTLVPVPAGPADSHPGGVEIPDPGAWLTRDDLLTRSGLDDRALTELERFGLVAPGNADRYDADALEIAVAAARLAEFGLHPRHLRAYRASADREIGLFGQLVAPMARRSCPAARAKAAEMVRELAALTERIHAALVRSGLRQTLGR